MTARLRSAVGAARRRGALWVRGLDLARALARPEGRALMWTRLAHGGELHQTSGDTGPDRYPELFDRAAGLKPDARRILSFGCSTGEELEAIRARFPEAEIVGAEINARSRRIAAERIACDRRVSVVPPGEVDGAFDVVFALAVLQVQPHRIERDGIDDLSAIYPFRRFDEAARMLAGLLAPGGLLCVMHAQYRVEDSRAAGLVEPVADAPLLEHPLFGPDGRKLPSATQARSMFVAS